MISDEHPFGDKAYVTPRKGSFLQKALSEITNDYGIEGHAVAKDARTRNNPAGASKGKIYVSEAIDEDTLKTFVPHETTHIMKQYGFTPYLNYIESTPEALDMHHDTFTRLFDLVKQHTGIDYFNIEESQLTAFYDELHCIVYGLSKGGITEDADFDYGWIPSAFKDFDSYINELEALHEQFKKNNAPKQEVTTNVEEAGTVLPHRSDLQGVQAEVASVEKSERSI